MKGNSICDAGMGPNSSVAGAVTSYYLSNISWIIDQDELGLM